MKCTKKDKNWGDDWKGYENHNLEAKKEVISSIGKKGVFHRVHQKNINLDSLLI